MVELKERKLSRLSVYLVMIVTFFAAPLSSAMAENPNMFALVTEQFDDKVSMIDLSVDPPVLITSIPVGSQPVDVAITPDGTTALVSDVSDGTLSVIQLNADPPMVSATIFVGGARLDGLDISPDGSIAAVAEGKSPGNIHILDFRVYPPSVIYLVPISYGQPYDVGITLDGRYAIVASGDSTGGIASVVDLSIVPPVEIYTINIGRSPRGVAMDPTGNVAVITTSEDDSVSIIDLTTSPFSLKATVPVGKKPAQSDISPDGRLAVVTNSWEDTVSIIDLTLSRPTVIATLDVGLGVELDSFVFGPRGVAIIDKDNIALVTNPGTPVPWLRPNRIAQIDLNTLTVIGSFSAGGSPNGIAIHEPAAKLSFRLTEDFETGDFSKLQWQHSGDANWDIRSHERYSGTYSAQAGYIENDGSVTLQVTLDCVSGNVIFYRKVSSESGYDYLKFYIDGDEKGKWSGEEDWAEVSFPIMSGTRTFEWTYSKDGSETGGSDTAWLDDIVFPVCGTELPLSDPNLFIVVDDFEDYNDYRGHAIFDAWTDGFFDPMNGSVAGNFSPPFAEQTIVHSGNQSMPLFYDNAVGISEATKALTYPVDWTENGVETLVIWYMGDAANAAEPLYVALNDNTVVAHDNPEAAQVNEWTEWEIDLQKFADQGLDLTDVNSITLGLGDRNNPIAGGSGKMYFDDIRLYQSRSAP